MLKVDMEYDKGILYVRLEVFNLFLLKDLDESGLDALLNTKCAIRTNKGKICLCEVSDEIRTKIKKLRINIASNELAANRLINI